MKATRLSTYRESDAGQVRRTKVAYDRRRAKEKGKTFKEHLPAARTYKQVGDILGITTEAVRQIERRALRKLRQALEGVL